MTFFIWKCLHLQDLKAAEERRDKKKAREAEYLEKEKQLNKLKVKGKSLVHLPTDHNIHL